MPVRRLEMALQPQPIDDVTFEELQHRRQLAKEARGKKRFDTIEHPTQGLAMLMDAFNTREYNRQAEEAEDAFKRKTAADDSKIVDVLSGMYSPGASNSGNNVPSAPDQGVTGAGGPGNAETGAQSGGIRLPDGRKLSGDQMRALLANKATRGFATKLLASQIGDANKGPKTTAAYDNYKLGLQDPGFAQRQMDLKKAGAANMTMKANLKGDSSQQSEDGKYLSKLKQEAMTRGAALPGEMAQLEILETHLSDPNLHTGSFANMALDAKKAFTSLTGIHVDGVADGIVARNLSNELALKDKEKVGGGVLSNSDIQLLQSLPPNILNTKEANRLLVSRMMHEKKYELAKHRVILDAMQNDPSGRGQIKYGDVIKPLNELNRMHTKTTRQFYTQLRAMAPKKQTTPQGAGMEELWNKYGLE